MVALLRVNLIDFIDGMHGRGQVSTDPVPYL